MISLEKYALMMDALFWHTDDFQKSILLSVLRKEGDFEVAVSPEGVFETTTNQSFYSCEGDNGILVVDQKVGVQYLMAAKLDLDGTVSLRTDEWGYCIYKERG